MTVISGSKKEKGDERPRGTDNDEREYRLILIMESGAGETLNFPAGVCLPSRLSRFGPAVSILRHLFTFLPLLFSPDLLFRPVSLFDIDFLSKARKYRAYRVTRALSNLVVCFALLDSPLEDKDATYYNNDGNTVRQMNI